MRDFIENSLFGAGGLIFVIGLLILCSGFFSSSETAITGASRARLHRLSKQDRSGRAKGVLKLMDEPDRVIGALLFGNNLVNIAASTLASAVFLYYWEDSGLLWATLVMTAVVLICAEILPKTIALGSPEKVALFVVHPLTAFVWLTRPITRTVHVLVSAILKLLRLNRNERLQGSDWHEAEIRGIIDLRHAAESGEKEERYMLHSVLDLDDVTVEEVMAHRQDVMMLNIETLPKDLLRIVSRSPHTRLPVFDGERDNIVGVLHVRRYLAAVALKGVDAVDWRKLMDKPWFLPSSATLMDKLHEFRQRRTPLGVVVDEYGEFQGIVTLEDILEEIVGEIDDEYDMARSNLKRAEDGSVLVPGDESIRNINRAFHWNIPDEKAATVGGLVIYESRSIPKAGQRFRFHNYRFEVIRRQRHRLKLLRVRQEAS